MFRLRMVAETLTVVTVLPSGTVLPVAGSQQSFTFSVTPSLSDSICTPPNPGILLMAFCSPSFSESGRSAFAPTVILSLKSPRSFSTTCPFLHALQFSGGTCVSSATQLLPEHLLQVGHVPALPVVLGSPPQCQPAFSTPTPGSDLMTEPSSLTVAVPIATNDARSWS